jgi:hypothetical protein
MADYQILQVERWTFLDARSNPVNGYRVTFRMEDGTIDFVDIREHELDPKIVGPMIEEKIIRHQAIRELGTRL